MSPLGVDRIIGRGVAEGMFAYTSGSPSLGADGRDQVAPAKVAMSRPMTEDEGDLDNGFLMVPAGVPPPAPPPSPGPSTPGPGPTPLGTGPVPPGPGPTLPGPKPAVRTIVRISFPATCEQVFKPFSAIANLADKSDSGKISIVVES